MRPKVSFFIRRVSLIAKPQYKFLLRVMLEMIFHFKAARYPL